MINETTNNLIRSTSQMLKTQGADIQQQAMSTNITVDTLKEAFRNTFDALDQLDAYKQKALPQMKQSIAEFRAMADEGQVRLDRIEAASAYRAELQDDPSLPKLPDIHS